VLIGFPQSRYFDYWRNRPKGTCPNSHVPVGLGHGDRRTFVPFFKRMPDLRASLFRERAVRKSTLREEFCSTSKTRTGKRIPVFDSATAIALLIK